MHALTCTKETTARKGYKAYGHVDCIFTRAIILGYNFLRLRVAVTFRVPRIDIFFVFVAAATRPSSSPVISHKAEDSKGQNRLRHRQIRDEIRNPISYSFSFKLEWW